MLGRATVEPGHLLELRSVRRALCDFRYGWGWWPLHMSGARAGVVRCAVVGEYHVVAARDAGRLLVSARRRVVVHERKGTGGSTLDDDDVCALVADDGREDLAEPRCRSEVS